MECEAYRSKLLEYVDRDLTAAAHAELEAHLTRCPGCREEEHALRETLALVARMPAPEPPEVFWQQYLRELRQKVAPAPRLPRLQNWLATLTARPIPALAVGIALFLAVFLTWQSSPERPPIRELTSLDLAQQLVLSQDLDMLREMDLLEEIDLLEDWELIQSRIIEGPRKAT
ncbi:MAG: zf-HC2 domain-containing protein [candidate division NC10 bacterium]